MDRANFSKIVSLYESGLVTAPEFADSLLRRMTNC